MKKLITMILLAAVVLLLSGCWSKRELSELAIVVALGIDKTDDEYAVSIQVVDPSEISASQSSSGRAPVVTYHATGETLFKAIRKVTTLSPRKAYFAHLQMLVVGEDLAREGLRYTIDFLGRGNEIRNDFNIIVAHKTTAKNVLNVLTPIEKIPANKMLNSIRVSQREWGSTLQVDVDGLINKLNDGGQNYVLSAVEVNGDPQLGIEQTNVQRISPSTILEFIGLAVFKQDKLIGLLSEEESRSYNFLNNEIKGTLEIISCPEQGQLTTEITNSKTKTKGKIKNGIPQIFVQIDVIQSVAEVNCDINLTDEQTLHMIDKETENVIKNHIEQLLDTIQKEYEADILGYGDVIHRENAKEWKKMKDDWPTLFPELQVNVEVNVNTQGLATLQNAKVKE
ncbi:Ger(x)C family spore germination protein [Lysinibacillus sp. KU-BSD001]|uniref:Ger(x)C family spore germination protein n=1 Tax=Lysinibacillus sp. KU-BSD001 TaxID=3141328 RepID=UPI0036E8892C